MLRVKQHLFSSCDDYFDDGWYVATYDRANPCAIAGIFDGDLLVVDRAIAPQADDIVIAVLHGELTVKRLKKSNDGLVLYAENPAFSDIALDDAGCEAWGVVTHSIRRHCAR